MGNVVGNDRAQRKSCDSHRNGHPNVSHADSKTDADAHTETDSKTYSDSHPKTYSHADREADPDQLLVSSRKQGERRAKLRRIATSCSGIYATRNLHKRYN